MQRYEDRIRQLDRDLKDQQKVAEDSRSEVGHSAVETAGWIINALL